MTENLPVVTPRAYIRRTIELRDKIEGAFLQLGERLYKIRGESLWKGSYETWGEFLTDMRISEATSSKMIKVYKTFVLDQNIAFERLQKAGWSNLYTAIPLLDNKTYTADEIVERAITWRRADLQNEVREMANPDCVHDWKEIHLRICTKCKERQAI